MKKKDSLTQKDKEDWRNYLKDTSRVPDKDQKTNTDSAGNRYNYDFLLVSANLKLVSSYAGTIVLEEAVFHFELQFEICRYYRSKYSHF